MDHYIFTDSSSVRQLVTKRGVGTVRHLDGKLLWIQTRKGFKMVQVPTDSSIADLNTKPLGGQQIRHLMHLNDYWHSEDQVRVGDYERREFEEKKNLQERRKGQQDCKDACENGSVGGLAANGYRSILERRRQYPVWIGRHETGRDEGIQ